jgi:hypothetical protein
MYVRNRVFDRSCSSMKNIEQDLADMNGTQSLNRNFYVRTTPTSPMHLMNVTSKSTSNLNTTTKTASIKNRKTKQNNSIHHTDSWIHGSHTLDSRLDQQSYSKNSTESDLDNDDDDGYLGKIKSKNLAYRTRRNTEKTIEDQHFKPQPNMNKIHARREIKDTLRVREERQHEDEHSLTQANYEDSNNGLTSHQNAKQKDTADDGKTSLTRSHSILSSYSNLSKMDYMENALIELSLSLKFSSPSILTEASLAISSTRSMSSSPSFNIQNPTAKEVAENRPTRLRKSIDAVEIQCLSNVHNDFDI